MHGHIVDCLEPFDRSRANEHQGWQKLSSCSGNHGSRLPARQQLQRATGYLYTVRMARFAAAALVLSLQRRFVRGCRYHPQQQTRMSSTLAAAWRQGPPSLPARVAAATPPQQPLRPPLQAR